MSTPVKNRSKIGNKEPTLTPVAEKIQRVKLSSPTSNNSDSENQSPQKLQIGSPIKSSIDVLPQVSQIYKIVHKSTGALGGNGATGAIYGELTTRALQRVYNIMVAKCGFNSSSRMIDVGAGLGKPNFHAAQDPAVRLSIGVELEDIRWQVGSPPTAIFFIRITPLTYYSFSKYSCPCIT